MQKLKVNGKCGSVTTHGRVASKSAPFHLSIITMLLLGKVHSKVIDTDGIYLHSLGYTSVIVNMFTNGMQVGGCFCPHFFILTTVPFLWDAED